MKAINPKNLDKKQNYKLLTGSVVPRAIAWVSSMSADGVLNLAPFSFFTVVSAAPPTLLFCPGTRDTDGVFKDTYYNVRDTGEFVVNIVTESLAEAMNASSVEAAADVNEFERTGVTPLASEMIRVPRVQESPIHFECKVQQIVPAGDAQIVIGEVVYMHFDERVYEGNNYINLETLQPIGRLAGTKYARVTDFLEMTRPPSEIE